VKRRSFLQFLGLAPAAAVAPKVAEAVEKVKPSFYGIAHQDGGEPDVGYVEVVETCCTCVAAPFTVKDLPGYVVSRRR
jgi:hypothetical protein